MNEENKFGPKKNWTRIFRKRWFFPSLYLVLAALLISVVVWYQNDGEEQEIAEEWDNLSEEVTSTPRETAHPAHPVMEHQEVVQFPVANPDATEIVTKFFDYDADETDKVNALIHYNNRYYQSTGIDIVAEDDTSFDVLASLSGTVSEVKDDPLLGHVVILDHGDGVQTYYASLAEVTVDVADSVTQGEVLGTAGTSNFGKDHGNHVHFEIRKDETAVNPEMLFNQSLASLAQLGDDDEEQAEEIEAEEAEDVAEEIEEETDETDDSEQDDSTEEDYDEQDDATEE